MSYAWDGPALRTPCARMLAGVIGGPRQRAFNPSQLGSQEYTSFVCSAVFCPAEQLY
jgi:hypothetical protein